MKTLQSDALAVADQPSSKGLHRSYLMKSLLALFLGLGVLSSSPKAQAQLPALDDIVFVDVGQQSAEAQVKLPALFIGKVKLTFTDPNGNTQEIVKLNVNVLNLLDLTLPISLTNLVPNTLYTVNAVATPLLGQARSTVGNLLQTLPVGELPLLDLVAVDVGSNGVKLNLELPNDFTGEVELIFTDENGNRTTQIIGDVANLANLNIDVNGLLAGTTYTVRAILRDVLNIVRDTVNIIIDTPILPPSGQGPTVTTLAATAVGFNTATLNGTVNPNQSATVYYYEYGRTLAYGSTTPSASLPSGSSAVPVPATLSGLTPNATYNFRLVATNNSGTSRGSNLTFVTTTVPEDTPNTAPRANDDFVFPQGTASTIAVLENDEDDEGDTLTISSFSQGQGGVVTQEGNNLVYTPSRNYRGSDTFTYIITDGEFNSTATVIVQDFFNAIVGNYNGLITNTTPNNNNTGLLSVKVGKRGGYTGFIQLGGLKHAFKGRFDAAGSSIVNVKRAKLTPVNISLQLNPFRGAIEGSMLVDNFSSTAVAKRSPFNIKSNQTTNFGKYNIVLNPAMGGANVPQGNGYLNFNITKTGRVRVTGKLSDTRPFTASAFLAGDGTFPLYNGIYGSSTTQRGSLGGDVSLESLIGAPDGNLTASSTLRWYKPQQNTGLYATGFTASVDLTGSRYGKPAAGTRSLQVSNPGGQVIVNITDGNLVTPINALFSWGTNNKFIPPISNPANIQIKVAPGTGVLTGSFVDPATGLKRTFRGVITQRQKYGSALFVGTNQTGTVTISENGTEPTL